MATNGKAKELHPVSAELMRRIDDLEFDITMTAGGIEGVSYLLEGMDTRAFKEVAGYRAIWFGLLAEMQSRCRTLAENHKRIMESLQVVDEAKELEAVL